MAPVWLVRHATPQVAPGTCYGRLDLGADPDDTRVAAARLAQVLPPATRLWVSPRQRCRQLADALQALRPDLLHRAEEPRIAEMDFGRWEGLAWGDIDPADMAAWTADFAHHAPGGGESVAAFMARVAAAWDAETARQAVAPGPSAWITHAGVVRAATLVAAGVRRVATAAAWPVAGPGFGQWTVVDPVAAADPSGHPARDPASRPAAT